MKILLALLTLVALLIGCARSPLFTRSQVPVVTTNALTGLTVTNTITLLTPSPGAQVLPGAGALGGPWGELAGALALAGLSTYTAFKNRQVRQALEKHIEETANPPSP
jgi:hypothetical protein